MVHVAGPRAYLMNPQAIPPGGPPRRGPAGSAWGGRAAVALARDCMRTQGDAARVERAGGYFIDKSCLSL